MPVYFGQGARWTRVPLFHDCGAHHTSGSFIQIHQLLGSYLPVSGTVTIYLFILLRVKLQSSQWRPSSVGPRPASFVAHNRLGTMQGRLVVTQMLFASSLWYCLCIFLRRCQSVFTRECFPSV
ncbi:hypothetical protein BV898_00194 [Hypsibius exemplaris]|uniref:Uncharacterized protein n=1 Tax=Hypsibius exemplaris TaxID=2072580 RepID=A0A1W0XF11_HYPEX|nr:hypothetical protein BV898_00194 [Hypsibius exemplaris]